MYTKPAGVPSAAESLELIRAGIAGLAAAGFDGYSASGLSEECQRMLRSIDELKVQAALRLARFDALGGPAGDDVHSLAGWLGRYGRIHPPEARRFAVTAQRLHLLDEAMAVFAGGGAGFDDVSTIAEAVDQGVKVMDSHWTAGRIAEEAQPILLQGIQDGLTPGQLKQAAKKVALTIDPGEGERRRRRLNRAAQMALGQTTDGTGVAHAEMGAADYAILEKTIDAYSPRRDPDAPRWQNAAGHRRLKGLIKACEAALAGAGKHGVRERGGAPVTVHIITTDPQAQPARAASTANGAAGGSAGTARTTVGAGTATGAGGTDEAAATARETGDAAGAHGPAEADGTAKTGTAAATDGMTHSPAGDPSGGTPGQQAQAGNAPGRTEFGTIVTAGDIRDLIRRGGPVRTLIVNLGLDGQPTGDFTSDGQPLNHGRRRRCHTPAQRGTYLALYLSCTGNGCDRPIAWCAIDHITEWDNHGNTDFANGQPLCDWHNLHKEHRRKRRNPREPHKRRRRKYDRLDD